MVAAKVAKRTKRKAAKKSKRKPNRSSESVAKRAEQNRAALQAKTRTSQDVGVAYYDLIGRGPKDKKRRRRVTRSFRAFCEAYFPKLFHLKWSKYHLTAIAKIEDAVLRGKLFAFAMPRGSGKTSLCRAAILWAALCGHCFYPLLVTATAASAGRRLESLKKMLRLSPTLAEDFPEVICAIQHLKNEPAKCRGQKFFGELTDIEWSAAKIVLPSIDLNAWPTEKPEEVEDRWISRATVLKNWKGIKTGFGAIIDVASMEGEIRGRSHTRNDGSEARPDLAVVDDPQTKRTAKSVGLTAEREEVLAGDIKYLSGPDRPIGVVIPCTVIYENDLADRILDKDRHPEYRGERSKMVDRFPEGWEKILGPPDPDESNTIKKWRMYRKIQLEDFAIGGDGAQTKFYEDHQDEMDRGFKVTWKERKGRDDASAIQHAVNLFFLDPAAFFAEAQNDPQGFRSSTGPKKITAADLLKCTNGIPRGVVPDDYDLLVGFIDVSESVLWWAVCAIRKSDFALHVVDFGTWPDQQMNYYQLSTIRQTLQRHYGRASFEAVLPEALGDLTESLTSENRWITESGTETYLDVLGIDSGWGLYAVDVYKFCRRSDQRAILQSTKGVGIKATNGWFVDPIKKPKKGAVESVSGQWKLVPTRIKTKLLRFDSNFAKSKLVGLFRLGVGSANETGFSIFQATKADLQVLVEQLTAEVSQRVKTKEREVDEFKEIPGRDNHFFDDLVGCVVLGHRKGAKFPETLTRNETSPESQSQPQSKSPKSSRRNRRRKANVKW